MLFMMMLMIHQFGKMGKQLDSHKCILMITIVVVVRLHSSMIELTEFDNLNPFIQEEHLI